MEAEAQRMLEEGETLEQAQKWAEAQAVYDRLLTQNPENPWLLAKMGTIFLRQNERQGMAIVMLGQAVKRLNGKAPSELLANYGLAYRNAGLIPEAIKVFEQAINHKDAVAGAYTNYAGCFVEKGEPERAIKLLEKALEMDDSIAMSHWNMSLPLLETHQWRRGWKEYEYGKAPGGLRPERTIKDLPVWDGKSPGRVVVTGEQGIGDEIMFSSMLPDVMKTNEVVFECHPRLKALFEHSWPALTCYPTRKDAEITWPENEKLDYRIAIGSLGQYLRNEDIDFPGTPYLKAQPLLPKGKKLRVGISWTGGRLSDRVAVRTVPLNWWRSILDNDCEFVSLQYTDCEEEIASVEALGYRIGQYKEVKDENYYETARLVASCDLVISVCTSAIHLAGALGVPCWTMVPKRPAWRYGASGHMRWYRSVRLYRQPEDGQDAWIPVVQRIGLDLSDKIKALEQEAA